MKVNEWFVTFNRTFFFFLTNFCESQSHENYFRESTISGTGNVPNNNSLVSPFFCFYESLRTVLYERAQGKRVMLNCREKVFCICLGCDCIPHLFALYSQYKIELEILLAVKAEFFKTLTAKQRRSTSSHVISFFLVLLICFVVVGFFLSEKVFFSFPSVPNELQ